MLRRSGHALGRYYAWDVRGHTPWRTWIPPVTLVLATLFSFKFVGYVVNVLEPDHQFKPVYDEGGKLVGFTHPVMVDATQRKRDRLDAEAAAKEADD